ncbi:MAG: glycine cleavage system protein GcvH [Bacteroidales bacterium]|nr:glycine cleavage system protein GcvH [Bacteroidales bacterium]
MNIPQNLKYSNDHEWVLVEGDIATVGVTDYAQKELGDIVYVEVDVVGETLEATDTFGTVEAVKTVADLLMPVSGEVLEKNESLDDQPELINSEAFDGGWIIKIKMSNPDELDKLLSPEDYASLIQA